MWTTDIFGGVVKQNHTARLSGNGDSEFGELCCTAGLDFIEIDQRRDQPLSPPLSRALTPWLSEVKRVEVGAILLFGTVMNNLHGFGVCQR